MVCGYTISNRDDVIAWFVVILSAIELVDVMAWFVVILSTIELI